MTDEPWERIARVLPSNTGEFGRSFGDHCTVVESVAYRYRTDLVARLPSEAFGPRQTVWKRQKKFADDGAAAASRPSFRRMPTQPGSSAGRSWWSRRSTEPTSTRRIRHVPSGTKGASQQFSARSRWGWTSARRGGYPMQSHGGRALELVAPPDAASEVIREVETDGWTGVPTEAAKKLTALGAR
ncbi:transposase [Isoptericola sp. NPDC057653]|uniref:transposase n=1 Tax=Isoptericola sp. NPDC057653 TaxID=3346195 RepID=UPI0036A26535